MKMQYASLIAISMFVAACDSGSDFTPPAANVAPTISAIADQSTVANQASQPITFSVSDEDLENLSYLLTSDNQAVVPDEGLALGGNGTNRSVTISPVLDTLGDAMINVRVTDTDGLMASSTFLLTITPEQQSLQQFTRSEFAETADDAPALVNAIEFAQDADNDDFADLLAN